MKLVIYGTGNYSKYFSSEISNLQNIEILYYVESNPQNCQFMGKPVYSADVISPDAYDFLVIATMAFDDIINHLKITFLDFSFEKYKVKSMELVLEVLKYSQWSEAQKYEVITLPCGLKYMARTSDAYIRYYMKSKQQNFSYDIIDAYFELAQKYCGYDSNESGIFFDIGANIGTTCLYAYKIHNSAMKIVGVEAGKDNYDLLRINCVLNGIENAQLYNVGFGDKDSVEDYYYDAQNPGGSHLGKTSDLSHDVIEVVKMDSFVKEHSIRPQDIKYVWMDTEGFEAAIISGASETLKIAKCPMVMEFNSNHYISLGQWNMLLDDLKKLYRGFVDLNAYSKGKEKFFMIEELERYAEDIMYQQTDLFLVPR